MKKRFQMIVDELMKEFTCLESRGTAINSGAYSTDVYTGKTFKQRFLENMEIELKDIDENYPLIERIVNAFRSSLIER